VDRDGNNVLAGALRASPRFDHNNRAMDELEATGSQTVLDHPAASLNHRHRLEPCANHSAEVQAAGGPGRLAEHGRDSGGGSAPTKSDRVIGPNSLMIGSPGAGKSMLAARLSGLLPDLVPAEALEVSMVHSVAGMLDGGRLLTRPPFREPHHSATQAALTGGGPRAKPGEVSLAHRGVLFLDELPEFPKQALESLRQSMESGRTTVARAAAHITYPARFQLVAAMNPCRCGYLGDGARECGRAPRCGEDYRQRISGALLDRVDLTVEVQPASASELARAPSGEASVVVAARVARARAAQRARYGESGPVSNAEVDHQKITLVAEAQALASQAMDRLRLSPRGYTRVLRVARTIADLAGAAIVGRVHVAEALAFRHRVPGR
jgi:magnesium chelatase family protein